MELIKLRGYQRTQVIAGATVAGRPVNVGGVIQGIAVNTTDAVAIANVASLTATDGGASTGYMPNATRFMYSVTWVDANGMESLPSFVLATTTHALSSIDLAWTAVSGAAAYRVYRGISGASAALCGKDPVFLTEVLTNACNDDGYTYTSYDATTADFEEIRVKGSSIRPPSSRDGELSRLIPDLLVTIVKRGVVELPVDSAIATGLAAMNEGTSVNWDVTNSIVTTTGTSGTVLALGTATFGYKKSTIAQDSVCVSINIA